MRVDLTGGYTDIEPIVGLGNSKAISAAINRTVHVRGHLSSERLSAVRVVDSSGLKLCPTPQPAHELAGRPGLVGLIGRILGTVGIEADLDVKVELPLGCGVGTSGSITVAATMCALAISGHDDIPVASLPHLAAGIERLCDHSGGLQDQLAATIGGFKCYDFRSSYVECVDLIHARSLLTGMALALPSQRRSGSELVRLVMQAATEDRNPIVVDALHRLIELGDLLLEQLSDNHPSASSVANSVLEVLEQQRRLHPEIDNSITQSPLWPLIRKGHCVAKPVGGAGKGSAWLILPPIAADVRAVLREDHWRVMDIDVSPGGARSHMQERPL